MTPDISERALEEAIERTLLADGPDDPSKPRPEMRARQPLFGLVSDKPGGFARRSPDDYDRELCLIPATSSISSTRPSRMNGLG